MQAAFKGPEISIHALLAESDACVGVRDADLRVISIHALLAESDTATLPEVEKIMISIHALLAESDLMRPYANFANPGFLSTLSLRRATRRWESLRLK